MKWTNPGYEDIYNHYDIGRGIILFGIGKIGQRYLKYASKSGLLRACVDNKSKLKSINDIPVWNFDELIKKRKDEKIIVTVGNKYQKEIVEQLVEVGLNEEIDFFINNDELLMLLYMKSFGVNDAIFIPLVQISLTERCTLRCKKCAHGCNYVSKSSSDLMVDIVYKSADYFFKYTDLCQEFVLIGGEPFLYKDLDKAIEYIGKNYRNKMSIFSITTNGTIIPTDNILELCNKYNMLIRISNYELAIPKLVRQHELLLNKLEEHRVEYILAEKEREWMDYGFDSADYGDDEKRLISHFDKCKTPCREIQGNKYYYCVMAHTVGKNMNHKGNNNDDFLDLSKLENYPNGKRVFLEYNLGYSKKGYLDMCRYCNGAYAKELLIPAAEQDIDILYEDK
ncbi:radical SAM protein [Butyrivibrio sp. AC2005]|uniref:radical SAM protein n=1 Tax=Butyrivibrio sp. AC2005 TaxID=1280672 RepID=UPI000416CC34|nr:4Fe-4S cluster-binding domain-containing protein [Butyrivibrio sp. AC2005]